MNVLRQNVKALLDGELQPIAQHGTNQHARGVGITNSSKKNDAEYALKRLKRDRPDLAERVIKGEIAANTAAVEAGFRPPGIKVRLDNMRSAARTLASRLTADQLDELDILEALIESNRQRIKTMEQVGREGDVLLKIQIRRNEIERENRRQDLDQLVDPNPTPTNGKAYKVVGEKLGVSHTTVHQAVSVVRAIDDLRESGKPREAEQLRTTLNSSAKKAYEVAKEAGYITPAPFKLNTILIDISYLDMILLCVWE